MGGDEEAAGWTVEGAEVIWMTLSEKDEGGGGDEGGETGLVGIEDGGVGV